MPHPLDESLALTATGPNRWQSLSSPLYWNSIGPFGGWIAAQLLNAVQCEAEARGDVIALQAQFIGGVRQAPFTLATACLRQNRSTAFWRAELRQAPEDGGNEQVCAHATVTLGNWRDTTTVADAKMPSAPAAPTLPPAPPRRFRTPEFVHRYDFRPVKGSLGTPSETMDSLMWVRDAVPRPLDARSVAAICDAPFPAIWLRMPAPVMITTVVYNVFFRVGADRLAAAGDGHVLLESRCAAGTRGFFDQDTSIWSESGELLAQSQQLAWFSDKPLASS